MQQQVGWTEDPNSCEPSYKEISYAIADGSTIYGIYEKTKTLTYSAYDVRSDGSVFINSKNSDPWRCCYYNKGDYKELFYEDVTEPYKSYIPNQKIFGWSLSGIDSKPVYHWNKLVDAAGGTPPSQIYACYAPFNNIVIGNIDEWENVQAYYGVNNEWKPVLIRTGVNTKWLGGENNDSTLGKAILGNMILGG